MSQPEDTVPTFRLTMQAVQDGAFYCHVEGITPFLEQTGEQGRTALLAILEEVSNHVAGVSPQHEAPETLQ